MLLTRTSEFMAVDGTNGVVLTVASNRSPFGQGEPVCALKGGDLAIGKLGRVFLGPVCKRPLGLIELESIRSCDTDDLQRKTKIDGCLKQLRYPRTILD